MMGRDERPWLTIVLIALMLAWAQAKTPVELEKPTPKQAAAYLGTYEGWFQWNDGTAKQPIRFKLERVVATNGSRVELSGSGVYLQTGTQIALRCQLDTANREFKLFELDPVGPSSSSFETDGFHQGKFSAGYKGADGHWMSHGKNMGVLHLTRL